MSPCNSVLRINVLGLVIGMTAFLLIVQHRARVDVRSILANKEKALPGATDRYNKGALYPLGGRGIGHYLT